MKTAYKYLIIDTETANTTKEPLTYDIGFTIADRKGKIYLKKSYIVADIFFEQEKIFNNAELMNTSYYHEKLPKYYEGIKNGSFEVKTFLGIRKEIKQLIKDFKIKAVFAYNGYFDVNALNTTIRYLTKSNVRYFFDYDTVIQCIHHFAVETICKNRKYFDFAYEHNLVTDKGNLSTTAESVYKFITQNIDFVESHTALQDALIETEILKECYKYHKKVDKYIQRNSFWYVPQKKWKEYKKRKENKSN